MGMSQIKWNTFLESGSAERIAGADGLNLLELFRNPFSVALREQLKYHAKQLAVIGAAADSGLGTYLPIEAFKAQSQKFFLNKDVARTFLSSGTTSTDRSQSLFSVSGLNLYKMGSLAAFFAVMESEFGKDFWNFRGLSLIPTTQFWGDSSLAQMVSWIGEFAPISYLNPETFSPVVKSLDSQRPVWVFGTAFHFVNLIDQGLSHPLPPRSLLIETGGTKGRSRELSTSAFHRLLCEAFNVNEAQILGEYGMCELASQAYRFSGSQGTAGNGFIFPAWVTPLVTTGLGRFTCEGSGTLLVHDPLRIDYSNSIRTQDMAEIHRDGTFSLLGRVPGAVLKGCSLLAEEVVNPNEKIGRTKIIPERKQGEYRSLDKDKLRKFLQNIPEFLLKPALLSSLKYELGCGNAAEKVLCDIALSMPKSAGEWEDALRKSEVFSTATDWIFILPNSHPIAGVYPLIFGALGNLKIQARIPAFFDYPNSSIKLWIDFLESTCNAEINSLTADFRISGDSSPLETKALLCFGSTETTNEVARIWGQNTVSFGSSLGVSILERFEDEDIAKLVDDFLGLGQKGCLSSRCVVIKGRTAAEIAVIQEKITQHALAYWNQDFTLGQKMSLDCEESRLRLLNVHARLRKSENEVLLPCYNVKNQEDITSRYLSAVQFVLPIINLAASWPNQGMFANPLTSTSVTIATNVDGNFQSLFDASAKLDKRPLGKANQPPWDGTLLGKPLFLFNDLR
jgi:hypothetical protein